MPDPNSLDRSSKAVVEDNMPRKPRIHAPGLLYHVICRGNQQQQIFFDEQDHRAYLFRLEETKAFLPFHLYAYALMTNHVHMLVEAGKIPLSKIMQTLQQRYTQHFNAKYKKIGHLFQGRFKAIVCDQDEYLMTLVRYIHLNPVRSKIVEDPADYPWTSHRTYMSDKADALIDRDPILTQFGKNRTKAQKKYLEFVTGAIKEGHREDLYDLKAEQVLGDDDFLKTLPLGALGDTEEKISKHPLGEIEKEVCRAFGINEKDLRAERNRSSSLARGMFCILAKDEGHLHKNIAQHLGLDGNNLSQLNKRTQKVIKNNPSHASILAKLTSRINRGQA